MQVKVNLGVWSSHMRIMEWKKPLMQRNFMPDGQRECMQLYHQVRGGATCMSNPRWIFQGRINGDGVDLMN